MKTCLWILQFLCDQFLNDLINLHIIRYILPRRLDINRNGQTQRDECSTGIFRFSLINRLLWNRIDLNLLDTQLSTWSLSSSKRIELYILLNVGDQRQTGATSNHAGRLLFVEICICVSSSAEYTWPVLFPRILISHRMSLWPVSIVIDWLLKPLTRVTPRISYGAYVCA